MAVVTELSDDVVADVIKQYDVGSLVEYWPADDGVENTNYFLRTSLDAEYVLTVVESTSHHNDLMVQVLDVAHRNDLPVAPVLASEGGAREVYRLGKPMLLSNRLPGRHVKHTNEKQCNAIGKFLAMFHLSTEELGREAHQYPRDFAWLAQHAVLLEQSQSPSHQSELEEALGHIKTGLEEPAVATLPTGIIHGDLFRDNALFDEGGLSGVVDFHHASHHYWIYDVAVAINDWCTTKQLLDTHRASALVQGYQEIRPFERTEIACYPIFGLYSAVAFWISRLAARSANKDSHSPASKDPDEFRRIAAQHLLGFSAF